MIFLFNTSYKRRYLEEIFAALHFPYGMVNEFQYPAKAEASYVDDSIKQNCEAGENVIISFVDRDADNMPVYLPVRKGELVSVQQEDDRIYINVKLTDYCHAIDEILYSNYIEQNFNTKVYHKENSSEWKGFLAIGKDININPLIRVTADSWITTVKRLSERKIFSDNYSIFTKIRIADEADKELKVVKRGDSYGYLLKSERKYKVKLSYYIHEYNNNSMTKIHAAIEDSQNICGIISKDMEINNKNSKFERLLEVKPINKLQSTSISIKCKEEKIGNKDIVHVVTSLNIFVDSKINKVLRTTLIVLSVLAIGVSTWISTMPVESIIKDAEAVLESKKTLGLAQSIIYDLSLKLNEYKYFYNAICSGVSTIFTFILVRFYGKPKL